MRCSINFACLQRMLMRLKGALRKTSLMLPCVLVTWAHGCGDSDIPSSNSVTQSTVSPTVPNRNFDVVLVEKDDEIHRLFMTLRDNPDTLHSECTPSQVRLAEQDPTLFMRKELWKYVESRSDKDEFLVSGVIHGVLHWYAGDHPMSIEANEALGVVSKYSTAWGGVGQKGVGVHLSSEDVLALKKALIPFAEKFAEKDHPVPVGQVPPDRLDESTQP